MIRQLSWVKFFICIYLRSEYPNDTTQKSVDKSLELSSNSVGHFPYHSNKSKNIDEEVSQLEVGVEECDN